MNLTDEQLLLLEQLTYFNSDISGAAEIVHRSPASCNTVEALLNNFDENALNRLEQEGSIKDTYTQGNEWAAVIRQIKSDPALMELKITNTRVNSDGKTAAICFANPAEPGKAVVAFRGTMDGNEWYDNVEGLSAQDTKYQQEALDYVEGLPYENITVVGHSKGGNKAQYVTIASDKVTRCVSMDGQGFSQEFLDKYWAEIQEKGHAIKNYSLHNDYVHILLFPMPGAQQLYFKGDGMANGLENHSSNSYFHYTVDKDGHAVLKHDENGNVYLEPTQEHESMIYLHEFVCFIANVMPDETKADVVPYLGLILGMGMSDSGVELDGQVYRKEDLPEFLLSKPESAATVMAYLLKYADVYALTDGQVLGLLDAFGMEKIVDTLKSDSRLSWLFSKTKGLVGKFLANLKDGKEDWIIEHLLSGISFVLNKTMGIEFDMAEFWQMVEAEFGAMPPVDRETALGEGTLKDGRTLNFSREAYEQLLGTIDRFESNTFESVRNWTHYGDEPWYSELKVNVAQQGIDAYMSRLTDVNSACARSIQRIFTSQWAIDEAAARKITALFGPLEVCATGLRNLADSIG